MLHQNDTARVSCVLRTADGVLLEGVRQGVRSPTWLVVAHGFSGSVQGAAVRRVVDRWGLRATVLAYDARGHGRSGGLSTLGDREVLDVDAAVAHARAYGAERVVTVGFSMGGAAVLRHAAGVPGYGLRQTPDAVVAVSSTGAWSQRASATGPLRRLHLLVETRAGRRVARVLMHTRTDPLGWPVTPLAPAEIVPRIGVPVLVVHGDRDGYFGLEHPRALGAAGATVWIEPGLGHAEVAVGPELLDRISAYALTVGVLPADRETGGLS